MNKKSYSDETNEDNWKANWDYKKLFKKNNQRNFREILHQYTASSNLDKHLLLGVLPPCRTEKIGKI